MDAKAEMEAVVLAIKQRLTFAVDSAVVSELVATARQWELNLTMLPFALREVMKTMARYAGNLLKEQMETLVVTVMTVLVLKTVQDANLQRDLVEVVRNLVRVYYSLSKNENVFETVVAATAAVEKVATDVKCFCC